MNMFKRTALAAALFMAVCQPVAAQYQVPNHSVPVGRGAGVTGFGKVTPGTAGEPLLSGGATADPVYGFLSSIWANYIQPAINAITRTVQSKLQEQISVLDFGATCNGTGTGDDAGFAAAIAALPQATNGQTGGTILVPYTGTTYPATGGGCLLSSTLNLNAKNGISIVGQAGVTGGASTSMIYYTGSGSRFIDARNSGGITFSDVMISYNNSAFSGVLFDAGGNTAPITSPPTFGSVSTGLTLNRVTLGAAVSTPLATLLNLDQATEASFYDVNFGAGNPSVRGSLILAGNSTVAKFFGGQFVGHVGPAVLGCGESWQFTGTTFEADSLGNANAFSNVGEPYCKNIAFRDTWMGDVGSTGTWISLFTRGADISANRIAGGAIGIALNGGGGIGIHDGNSIEATTGVTCVNSTTGGGITNNYLAQSTTPYGGGCVNFALGHNDPDISPASGTPTIASGACGTGTNGTIAGSNASGLITIGAVATTSCAVSFSATLAAAPNACQITPANAAAAATGTTVARVGAPSTSGFTITGSALANTVYGYSCSVPG